MCSRKSAIPDVSPPEPIYDILYQLYKIQYWHMMSLGTEGLLQHQLFNFDSLFV